MNDFRSISWLIELHGANRIAESRLTRSSYERGRSLNSSTDYERITNSVASGAATGVDTLDREAGASGGMWPASRELACLPEHKAQSTKCMCMCKKSGGVEVRDSRFAMLSFKGYLRPPSSGPLVQNVSMLHENVVGSDCPNCNYHHLKNQQNCARSSQI